MMLGYMCMMFGVYVYDVGVYIMYVVIGVCV